MATSLTQDQQAAYDAIMHDHKNVFLTGNAGTGKSYVLRKIMDDLDANGTSYVAAAATGIAALNVNGETLHHLLHVKPGIIVQGPDSRARDRWKQLFRHGGILIIDEISMCRLDMFELLVKTIKDTEQTTGKPIQVILVGDFYQLPPIVARNESKTYFSQFQGTYAFESKLWHELHLTNIILHEEVRQKQTSDEERWFVQALNHIRFNDQFALNAINYINQQCYHAKLDPKAMYLCGYRRSADKINQEHLDSINKPEAVFHAYADKAITKSTYPADEALRIKIGARVMCIKNTKIDDDTTIFNGQVGTVIDARLYGDLLSNSSTNLSTKAPGASAYKNADKQKYDELYAAQDDNEILVDFDQTDSTPHQRVWISWDYWSKNEYYVQGSKIKSKTLGYFGQMPLKLAYAITIHKAQGQTISGNVNLRSEIFAPGQLYVGLSRVKSIKNLYLENPLTPRAAIPNLTVTAFYKQIDPAMQNMTVHYDRSNLLQQLNQIINQMPDEKLAQFIKLANLYK